MAGPKQKSVFVCSECGRSEPKWLGRCPECGQWNTLVEQAALAAGNKSRGSSRGGAAGPVHNGGLGKRGRQGVKKPQRLDTVKVSAGIRFTSGISEMDSVLGGGIMKGSAVLIGGEPGIGKSTLLLQVITLSGAKKALYVSGEESSGQIKLRSKRLGLPTSHVTVLCETRLENLMMHITEERYDLVIVDSIQTIYSEEAGSVPGTVNQIKYGTLELADTARENQAAIFLIGHVTKDGTIAGPKIVEHLVDTVLYFDHAENGIRILRSSKNRFGSVEEIGVFTMTEKGLVPAGNPESFFMGKRTGTAPAGVAAAAVFEGSRTFMVEIQALTVPAKSGYSRVYSDRVDSARVSRIAAVLEKHTGVSFNDYDIYINVAGGIRLAEVGIELPLAIALYSARINKPLSPSLASAGELSLAGEIRAINHVDKRLATAAKMGFEQFIGPEIHDPKLRNLLSGSVYSFCSDIREVISILFTGLA